LNYTALTSVTKTKSRWTVTAVTLDKVRVSARSGSGTVWVRGRGKWRGKGRVPLTQIPGSVPFSHFEGVDLGRWTQLVGRAQYDGLWLVGVQQQVVRQVPVTHRGRAWPQHVKFLCWVAGWHGQVQLSVVCLLLMSDVETFNDISHWWHVDGE